MNAYRIKTVSDENTLAIEIAKDAPEALKQYSEKATDVETGYTRGGLHIDALTRGIEWASIRTDGGRIEAVLISKGEA